MRNAELRRRWASIATITLVAAFGLGTAVTSEASSGRPEPSATSAQPETVELSPLVVSVLEGPHPVLGADDRQHLAYELLIADPAPFDVTVEKVETIDPVHSVVVGTLEGPELAAVMGLFGGKGTGNKLSAGAGGFMLMDTTFDEGATLPGNLVQRFTVSFEPGHPVFATTFPAAPTKVVHVLPVVLDPPLSGARWVALGGCCANLSLSYHRAALLPLDGAFQAAQRFAIDFAQLDAQGRLFEGPRNLLTSYAYYGDKIRSVAAGVVAATQDGLPDNTPGSFSELENLGKGEGNFVIVDIGGGRFAFYTHMIPGSLKVKVGDHVAAGQILGLLGNSGNSDAPHLHFAILDRPSPFNSNSLPYEFSSFDSEGTVTTSDDDLLAGVPASVNSVLRGPHANQLPLEHQLISFRGA